MNASTANTRAAPIGVPPMRSATASTAGYPGAKEVTLMPLTA